MVGRSLSRHFFGRSESGSKAVMDQGYRTRSHQTAPYSHQTAPTVTQQHPINFFVNKYALKVSFASLKSSPHSLPTPCCSSPYSAAPYPLLLHPPLCCSLPPAAPLPSSSREFPGDSGSDHLSGCQLAITQLIDLYPPSFTKKASFADQCCGAVPFWPGSGSS